jgi:hypothetical protein
MKRYTMEVTELEREITRQYRRHPNEQKSILKLLDIEEDQKQKRPTPDYLRFYRK